MRGMPSGNAAGCYLKDILHALLMVSHHVHGQRVMSASLYPTHLKCRRHRVMF